MDLFRVYFSGGVFWDYVRLQGRPWARKIFLFSFFFSEDDERGQQNPMHGSTEDLKKEGSKKMKKASGGQKEELPWVFFSKRVLFSTR
jgi:hypothetical protein